MAVRRVVQAVTLDSTAQRDVIADAADNLGSTGVNGGGIMRQSGGVIMHQGLGGSLSP